jgi:hypothetical protein
MGRCDTDQNVMSRVLPLLTLGVFIVLLFNMLDQDRINRTATLFDRQPVIVSKMIAEEWLSSETRCAAAADEFDILARAIVAVEELARTRLEQVLEAGAVKLFFAFGARAPDLSIGPGQIRVSTMKRALRSISISGEGMPPEQEIANGLFDQCGALSAAKFIIEKDIGAHLENDGLLSRAEVLRIAKLWNGQSNRSAGEAAIANLRYRELVYQTFLAMRSKTMLTHGSK